MESLSYYVHMRKANRGCFGSGLAWYVANNARQREHFLHFANYAQKHVVRVSGSLLNNGITASSLEQNETFASMLVHDAEFADALRDVMHGVLKHACCK